MLQEFIDKNFCRLLIFTLIFGVILYDTIRFSYTDELCSLLIFILFLKYVFSTPQWEVNKMFLATTAIFLFYLCYSFYIGSNCKAGIVSDFIIQYKPYLGFFCVYAIKPTISPADKKLICKICIILGFYLCGVALAYLIYPTSIYYTLNHPSRLATAVSIVGLLYLYCSDYTVKDKIIFILMIAIGLCSGRSKFYGFFILCTSIVLLIRPSFKVKLNIKNIVLLTVVASFVLFFTYQKIDIYFIGGGDFLGDDEKIEDAVARAALYFHSLDILTDFFPLGSGFASYATYSSGVYYSDIYKQYGMDNIFGMTKNDYKFIADTYYPALAQFGYVGMLLFFIFWGNLALKAQRLYKLAHKEVLMALMIIMFFMIECTTDSTITNNRGLFMMMLLGLLFSDLRNIRRKNESMLSSK